MTTLILIIPLLVAFFTSLFLIPFWIRKANQIGLMWNDMNKLKSPKVAGSGGIMVVLGFIIAVLSFVAYRKFYLDNTDYLIEIFSVLLCITMLAGVGLVDDLLGWQSGGLSRRSRIIIILMSTIPLIVIRAGQSLIDIPFLGELNLGLVYPLILIPIGILGATTTFNFLAGFNGLEAGQGIIILSALSLVSYLTGSSWLAIMLLCMVASLLAFMVYNWSPAQVFPGNSITLTVGALIAISSILGNFERIALFFFIPYIIEFFLKSRGKLIKQSFGKPLQNGELDLRYDKIYGTTHFSILLLKKMKIKPTEERVVLLIWFIQIIVIIIGFFLFKEGIFI